MEKQLGPKLLKVMTVRFTRTELFDNFLSVSGPMLLNC
jgi:hypothetical protein